MLVDWGSEICGLRMLEIRNLLGRLAEDQFSCGDLVSHLRITTDEAAALLARLTTLQLVEMGPSDDEESVGQFCVTEAGRRLVAARAVPRIGRSKADMLLAQFLERVRHVNMDDAFAFYVDEIRVFGSYLDSAVDHLGDIDIAAGILLRRVPGRDALLYRRERERLLKRGIFDAAREEVRMLLKARSPYISLSCLATLQQLGAQSKLVFKTKRTNVVDLGSRL